MNATSILKKIAGALLIIVGVAGLFLPFLQGIFMIFAGAALLGNQKIINWFKKLQRRFKKFRRRLEKPER